MTTKQKKQAEADRIAERAMRDRMNGIHRDVNGVITHRNNKPVVKVEVKQEGWCDASTLQR